MQGRIAANTRISTVLAGSLILTGCLSASQEPADSNAGTVDADISSLEASADHDVTGSVGDGPVVGAAMQVLAQDGAVLMDFESDTSAGYEVTVRAKGKYYPLHIHARHGIDVVTNIAPDFELTGIVPEPGKKSVANLNPYSTLVFHLAQNLAGGLTKENIQRAQYIVVRAFAGGLTSMLASGPLSTAISPDNAAEIIRASEELGETVRRTRDGLTTGGSRADGDAVIAMLASDLVDEVVDGRGGRLADERASAISIFASAGVMLESMQMEMRVYGTDATAAMNLAITRIVGGSSSSDIGKLTIAEGQVSPARKALAIARELNLDPRVPALLAAVESLQIGMGYQQARMVIPDDYRNVMNDLLAAVTTGDDTLVSDVNRLAAEVPASPVNRAPVIGGTPPASVVAGTRYVFTPTASDPDADALTFSGTNIPAWARLDPSSGMLSGIPDVGAVGVYAGIEISVSDGEFLSTLGPFSIQVNRGNSPPTLSGEPPQTVLEGQLYQFTPSANDPDGDALRFTAQGLPNWLTLDAATGRISGMPTAADIGQYENIILGVSDGLASSTLGPFAIQVNATGTPTGSVTLSWTPPTENTDGSSLTNLAGYRLYLSSTTATDTVTVSNPGVTTYVIENLAPGTYQVTATAFNAAGIESENSEALDFVVD